MHSGETCSGLRPVSADGLHYIGSFAATPNLIAAVGQGSGLRRSNGSIRGASSGRHHAEQVTMVLVST